MASVTTSAAAAGPRPDRPHVVFINQRVKAGERLVAEWLDRQPTGSVVYVSFGSAGTLSVEQTAELAAGLEDSGHRFLWIVRMPSLEGEHSDGMGRKSRGGGDENDPLAWLPEGFLERTRGRGLAVASWAPQVRVLSHPATAAFVSHCGWNSTLESRLVRRADGGVAAVRGAADERRGPVGERGRGIAAARPHGRRAGWARADRGGGEGADGGGGWARRAAPDGGPAASGGPGVRAGWIVAPDVGRGRRQVDGGYAIVYELFGLLHNLLKSRSR
ncbi:unnamed protein product [Miscanthus lutarioriparius]|uniref:Uncharacterized protein n=1 Tax=Miscanthus lutarioriparius TaxID=422564 RepID=A0A811N4M9_9POAL|nr:unnamed protein product [Miscanthus lutarioriparius]